MMGYMFVPLGDVSECRVLSDSVSKVAAFQDCKNEVDVDLKRFSVAENSADPVLMK